MVVVTAGIPRSVAGGIRGALVGEQPSGVLAAPGRQVGLVDIGVISTVVIVQIAWLTLLALLLIRIVG
jgi:hypothetical protein